MEWLLDNLQFVIAIILLVAYSLRGMRRATKREEDEDAAPMEQGGTEFDPDEAERTRRIQEEIRRRILARQRGEQSQPQQPAPVFEDRSPPEVRRTPPAPPTPPPAPPTPPRATPPPLASADAASYRAPDQSIMEQQRRLEEQLRELRQSQKTALSAFPATSTTRQTRSGRKVGAMVSGDLRAELHHPGSLRRAVLLREILGPPQGLEFGPPRLPRL